MLGVGLHKLKVKLVRRFILVSVLNWIFLIFLHNYGYFLQKLLIQLLNCKLFLFRHVLQSIYFQFQLSHFELKLLYLFFQKFILLLYNLNMLSFPGSVVLGINVLFFFFVASTVFVQIISTIWRFWCDIIWWWVFGVELLVPFRFFSCPFQTFFSLVYVIFS